MSATYGNFQDMALCFLKRLAEDKPKGVVMFQKTLGGSYGVCSFEKYAQLVKEESLDQHRPVMTLDKSEFIALMTVRYADLFKEDTDANNKTGLQTREQPGDKSSGVDAGANRNEERGDAPS